MELTIISIRRAILVISWFVVDRSEKSSYEFTGVSSSGCSYRY